VVLIYDAMGRMVEQANGGTCSAPGNTYQQILYGIGGAKLALMNGQNLNKAFIALPGGATAVYNGSGLQYYRHADWLGSSRLASTTARTVYYDGAYAPFGENYNETGTTDRSFTGQNQDTVPGLYDFMFREQNPTQGRWISPDPAGLDAVDMTNPQSWNRYAYVSNSLLAATDPLGLAAHECNAQTHCDQGGHANGSEWPGDDFSSWVGAGIFISPDFWLQDASQHGYTGNPFAGSFTWTTPEEAAEVIYQRQVDCGSNPDSCPNGPDLNVPASHFSMPGGVWLPGGSVSGQGTVDGNVTPHSSFFESFAPEWVTYTELDSRLQQYPQALYDARAYVNYMKANPNATRNDFNIFQLSDQIAWMGTHPITGCQYLGLASVTSLVVVPESTLPRAIQWIAYGAGATGVVAFLSGACD
jgi:RHS repeat-associated protein